MFYRRIIIHVTWIEKWLCTNYPCREFMGWMCPFFFFFNYIKASIFLTNHPIPFTLKGHFHTQGLHHQLQFIGKKDSWHYRLPWFGYKGGLLQCACLMPLSHLYSYPNYAFPHFNTHAHTWHHHFRTPAPCSPVIGYKLVPGEGQLHPCYHATRSSWHGNADLLRWQLLCPHLSVLPNDRILSTRRWWNVTFHFLFFFW